MMQVSLVPVTPFEQNCAVIRCDVTGQGAIVDPGGDIDSILAVVEAQHVAPQMILLTHGHLDHAAAGRELADQLGLQVVGPHKDDQFWLDKLPEQATMFGLGEAQAFRPDRYLSEGETLRVGEIELQVLHCPGHTPGHIAFFDPASRTVLLGDLLFRGSIGRTDFPRSDPAALLHGLHHSILPLGDDVTFHCGHGSSGTLGEERRSNPFLQAPEPHE